MRSISRRSFLGFLGGVFTATVAALGLRRSEPVRMLQGCRGWVREMKPGQYLYTEDAIYYAHPDTPPVMWTREQIDSPPFDLEAEARRQASEALARSIDREFVAESRIGVFIERRPGVI